MAGVQVMPAVGAVDVGLGRRRVAAASRSGAGLFVGDCRRRSRRPAACSVRLRQCRIRRGGLAIVCNLGGVYEDDYSDVDVHRLLAAISQLKDSDDVVYMYCMQLVNYFTYKAVRTVMTQLYEMNPPSYRWFYNFVVVNKPTDGKFFLRALGKERQELAERVMITRLHLYGKWIKKCDHAKMYEKISDENLELMRERLMETVIWPTDDTNTEKIG